DSHEIRARLQRRGPRKLGPYRVVVEHRDLHSFRLYERRSTRLVDVRAGTDRCDSELPQSLDRVDDAEVALIERVIVRHRGNVESGIAHGREVLWIHARRGSRFWVAVVTAVRMRKL